MWGVCQGQKVRTNLAIVESISSDLFSELCVKCVISGFSCFKRSNGAVLGCRNRICFCRIVGFLRCLNVASSRVPGPQLERVGQEYLIVGASSWYAE